MKIRKFIKERHITIALLFLLVILYLFLYKIYMPRVNAFGCFDDCDNFMGGYFLLHGKRLYSEIFFNHNPLMAYVSLLVQFLTHPQNLYELILRHRQALLLFSFIFNALLVMRFGAPAFAFALFYELTKFYLFGDRFLGDAFIVYPLVYLTGLVLFRIQHKKIGLLDYLSSGVFAWFIIFTREPYLPIAALLFSYLLWDKKILERKMWFRKNKRYILSFGIFLALSLLTVFLHDVEKFFFSVVTANIGTHVIAESTENGITGWGIFKIFLYPLTLYFGGEWGYFRYLLVSLDTLFFLSVAILIMRKQWRIVVFIFLALGFLSIRYVVPGKAFYGAFHMLCWYAIFLFISCMMLGLIYRSNRKLSLMIGSVYMMIFLFHIASPLSFLHTKPDPHYDLITNYGVPMQVGNVVHALSSGSDNLFLDGFDDIIYWQAQRLSPYKYSLYTGVMPGFTRYTDARTEMFQKSPPDFYYGSCPKEKRPNYLLPDFVKNAYVRLFSDKKASCLWIKKSKLRSISSQQWKEAQKNLYYLP